MHPAGGVQLAHGGINNRKTGLPALPGLQGGLLCAPGDLICPGSKWPPFTELRIVDHQMAVKLAPDQLVKPGGAGSAVQRGGMFRQQTMQALAGGQHADGQAGRQATGPFHGREVALPLVIRRRLLTKRAQTRQRRFFIRGKQQPVERRLRVVKLRQRRRLAGRRLARLRGRHARRQSVPQTANKRIFKRGEDFIHFAATGQYAAGRQQDAVVKALANHVAQGVLNGGIALAFIEFVLIVVEQVTDLMLLAKIGQPFDAGGKIVRLFYPQRYAPFRQRGMQTL